ncbi:unnamed protein product [Diamesa serratosioi]
MDKKNRMNILDLPQEMLLKILGFVLNRNNCYLVCQQFNEICCMITIKNGILCKIEWDHQLNDPEFYESVINTYKFIRSIRISMLIQTNQDSYAKIKSIIEKHGSTTKNLALENCYLFDKQKLDNLLKLVPNVETITLNQLSSTADRKQHLTEQSEDHNLHHLRELTLIDCFAMEKILELIPKGVITSFTVDIKKMNTLTKFFLKQTNIKRLSTSIKNNEIGLTQPYNHLQLHHLQIQYCHSASLPLLKSSIQNQPNLHSLELGNIGITDDIFRVICGLRQLRILKLSLNNLSTGVFGEISQLKNLTELTIDYCYNNEVMEYIKDFSFVTNNNLHVLDIMAKVSTEDLLKIRENNPNMQKIIVNVLGKLELNGDLAKNFNKIKVLKLHATDVEIKEGNYEHLLLNLELKILHLQLPIDYTIDIIKKMSAIIPNVENLKLKPLQNFTNEIFNEILISFPKLKQLTLFDCHKLSVSCVLKSIEKHGLNLDCIMLYRMNVVRKDVEYFVRTLCRPFVFESCGLQVKVK